MINDTPSGVTAAILALLATIVVAGGMQAQSPTPAAEPGESSMAVDRELLPTAGEVGEAMGAEVELLGVEGGLSQAWEASDFVPETVRSSQMAIYMSAREEGSRHAALIDVVRFASAADAVEQTGELLFGDEALPGAFETDLVGDVVATMSFESDGTGGAFIYLVAGSDAFSVTALMEGAAAPEAEAEAIAEIILQRLASEPAEAAYGLERQRNGAVGHPLRKSGGCALGVRRTHRAVPPPRLFVARTSYFCQSGEDQAKPAIAGGS